MVKGQVWEFLIQKQGKGGVIEKTSTSEDEEVCVVLKPGRKEKRET